MANYKKSIAKYILEILIVTFGVALGFFITDKRNERSLEKKKEEGINLMKIELTDNTKRLEKSIAYHSKLDSFVREKYQTMTEEDFDQKFFMNNSGFDQIPIWEGVGMYSLDRFAFETAKDAQLLVEYDLATCQQLTKAYKITDSYKQMTEKIMDRLFAFDFNTTNRDVYFLLEIIINDVKGSEKQMLKRIEETISALPYQ